MLKADSGTASDSGMMTFIAITCIVFSIVFAGLHVCVSAGLSVCLCVSMHAFGCMFVGCLHVYV